MSSKWSFLSGLPAKAVRKKILFFFVSVHMPRQSLPPQFDTPNNIYCLVQINLLLIL